MTDIWQALDKYQSALSFLSVEVLCQPRCKTTYDENLSLKLHEYFLGAPWSAWPLRGQRGWKWTPCHSSFLGGRTIFHTESMLLKYFRFLGWASLFYHIKKLLLVTCIVRLVFSLHEPSGGHYSTEIWEVRQLGSTIHKGFHRGPVKIEDSSPRLLLLLIAW